jgi:hypothetical protein
MKVRTIPLLAGLDGLSLEQAEAVVEIRKETMPVERERPRGAIAQMTFAYAHNPPHEKAGWAQGPRYGWNPYRMKREPSCQ